MLAAPVVLLRASAGLRDPRGRISTLSCSRSTQAINASSAAKRSRFPASFERVQVYGRHSRLCV
jgi:hypothetical protein